MPHYTESFTVEPTTPKVTMTFSQAMEAIRDGQRITKLEWTEPEVYCELRDNLLMIRRNNNWHTWTISDGDIFGTDWVVVNA